MVLKLVEIEGYRSISQMTTLHMESTVTVVLGANDHGKSNLLSALLHLNDDRPFEAEDLNWDLDERGIEFPKITATFIPSESERKELLLELQRAQLRANEIGALIQKQSASIDEMNLTRASLEAQLAIKVASKTLLETADEESASESEEDDEEQEEGDEDEDEDFPAERKAIKDIEQRIDLAESELTSLTKEAESYEDPFPKQKLGLDDMPTTFSLQRQGIAGELNIWPDGEVDCEQITDFLWELVPRFELIEPLTKVSDSVTWSEFEADGNDFMKGIFYYAGLKPSESESIFVQSDANQMALQKASEKLNKTLKSSWTQGKDLTFTLRHDSATSSIELIIHDPAVGKRFVRASKRSNGFTHYFSLKTILFGREQENPARSHIWLFDEPGVFLHPSGQHDLMMVLESLGKANQVVYVTHSIFLINRTYPTRHRLIRKGGTGTHIEGKPFLGRWGVVLATLGLSLSGTIFFADYVLLTEGDSDDIYIYSLFQKLASLGEITVDMNSFSCLATGESQNADALIRMLGETATSPRIGILVDGDAGGKDRILDIKQLILQKNISVIHLSRDSAIEDYLPLIDTLYVRAVSSYCAKLLKDRGGEVDEEQLLTEVRADFDSKFSGKSVTMVAQWASEVIMKLANLKNSPSKVGIAREYARLLEEFQPVGSYKADFVKAKNLCKKLVEEMGLPQIGEPARDILI